MLISILSLAVGLLLLYFGAEGLVRGSAALALRLGLTRLVIGLTVVAYGTSAPELVVSVGAALEGNSAIALGNIVGSNICNIALILGLSAVIAPLRVHAQVIRMELPIMIAVSVALPLMFLDGHLSRLDGTALLFGIIVYTGCSVYLARKNSLGADVRKPEAAGDLISRKSWMPYVYVLFGLAMLVGGAKLFVSGAIALADSLEIGHALIGLTIVAVGTSLPELATSLVASMRKEGDIAVGNVVGSNIFNILGILGVASLVHPIATGGVSAVDFLLMIIVATLVLPIMRTGFLLTRWEGALLLVVYIGYIAYLVP